MLRLWAKMTWSSAFEIFDHQGKGNHCVSHQLMMTFYQIVHEMPRVVLLPKSRKGV
jgi:hypothetical protein